MKISRTKHQIRQEIKQISSVDVESVPIGYLKHKIDGLLKGMWTPWFGGPFHEVWRARKGEFNHVSELWYPPKECVSKLGRMNEKNDSMFYSCFGLNARPGSLEEIRADVGDRITQLSCSLNPSDKLLKVLSLGHADQWMKEKAPSNMKHRFINAEAEYKRDCGSEEQYQRSLLLKDWVNEKFIENVADGEEHNYAHSVAISKGFFDGFNCDAILYPSVAASTKAINLVMRPEVADDYFTPIYARIVEVLSKSPTGIELKLKNESKSISTDGTINWSW